MWNLTVVLSVAFIAFLGVIYARKWQNDIIKKAREEVRRHQLKMRLKIADQSADMIIALIRVTRPHLKAKKTYWGKSLNGEYSGTAVDIEDPNGNWSIVIESYGNQKGQIFLPLV